MAEKLPENNKHKNSEWFEMKENTMVPKLLTTSQEFQQDEPSSQLLLPSRATEQGCQVDSAPLLLALRRQDPGGKRLTSILR